MDNGAEHKYYRIAILLALITIFYNFFEGLVSVWFGEKEGALSLFGFGLDSFIEIISGIGILHMLLRLAKGGEEKRQQFEKTALQITGGGFFILALGLIFTSAYNFYNNIRPETTVAGIIIAAVSIIAMYVLIHFKMKTGKALHSDAIIADAACSKVCLYMSIVLLTASGCFELFHWIGFDLLGSLGLAWFSFSEGSECLEKARKDISCTCHNQEETEV